jgi:putative heme iron utilization protein
MNIRRYNSTYFKHKLYDSSIRKSIISYVDHKRIQKQYSHLQNIYETKKEEYKHKLLPTYEEYITKVSTDIMAISLELSVFYILICDIIRPQKIAEDEI